MHSFSKKILIGNTEIKKESYREKQQYYFHRDNNSIINMTFNSIKAVAEKQEKFEI